MNIKRITILFFLLVGLVSSAHAKPDVSQIYGKIQVVNSFPDFKVQIVDSFPDLKVQKVTSFPDSAGKWQFVDAHPDYKIQFVDSFPDFKIQYVTSFPGPTSHNGSPQTELATTP